MTKKALICGVSGQDGAYLSSLLLEKGYEVYGFSRNARDNPFHNLVGLGIRDRVHLDSVDLSDLSSVSRALMNLEPDEVYNLAGQSSVGLSFQEPAKTFNSIALATLNLLEAIRTAAPSTRFFNANSGDCFGDTGDSPANEATPFRPMSPYATAKTAAYWQVANYRDAYGIYACSGLMFNHESPLRASRFVTRKVVDGAVRIASGQGGKLHLGDITISRDWGWAPEYVVAMWMMLQQTAPRDYIVATGKSHRLEDFVEAAFRTLGLDWRDHVESDPAVVRPLEIHTSKADPSQAAADLGWQATYRMVDVARMMVENAARPATSLGAGPNPQ